MNKIKKNNVVKFPEIKVTDQEKEIEAILFASSSPLDIESIESKITKKINVEKSLEKLKKITKSEIITISTIKKKYISKIKAKLVGYAS